MKNLNIQKILIGLFVASALVVFGISSSKPKSNTNVDTCHTTDTKSNVPQDREADCEKVKDKPKCTRKTGCQCKLNCDESGRRLNEDSVCAVYCCPSRCDCHPLGCP